jgi:hypothetical protein
MHLTSIRTRLSLAAVIATMLVGSAAAAVSAAAAFCYPTGYVEDGINLTAAQIGGTVTGPLDAGGCNIGVYYGPTDTGSVDAATIFDANYYGVLVNGADIDVTNSHVYDIGDNPAFTGAQHGDAIAYRNGASGTISGNTVDHYQKTGILVTTGSSASILTNTVTGMGPTELIAQNGIQISYGATAQVIGNTVTGNDYLPKSYVACGLLIYKAGGVSASKGGVSYIRSENNIHGNEVDICNFGKGGSFRD